MKIYTELSNGKWIVTDNEVSTQNGEFLLIPLSKGLGSSATTPTLICDCNDATTLWNGKGFVVTLPITNTTHSFTLVWGDLTRTFQLIVSNRDFSGEIGQLQNEKLALDTYAQNQNSQFKNFISSIEIGVNNHIDSINSQVNHEIENSFSAIRSSNEALKNIVIFFENMANTNVQNLTSLRDEAISRNDSYAANAYSMQISGYSDAAYRFSYIRTEFVERLLEDQFESAKSSVVNNTSSAISSIKNKISEFAEQERNVLNRSDSELANLRSQQVNIVPINNNSQLQQENEDQKRTIADLLNERSKLSAHAQILQNIILNNENMFHLVDEGGGVYSYELNPRINLPNNLPISYSYFLFSGPNTYISSRCPLVWTDERGDESGKEVIRNFSCTFDRYRLVICNQDNDTYRGNHDVLMYSGNTDVNDQKIVPQRLIGEGFFAISVTAYIGNYSYTSDIPVCISGNPNYAPVGGVVDNLQDKINLSGFPSIDTSS